MALMVHMGPLALQAPEAAGEGMEPEEEEELPEVTSEMLEGLKTLDGSTKVLEELYIMRNINERKTTGKVKLNIS